MPAHCRNHKQSIKSLFCADEEPLLHEPPHTGTTMETQVSFAYRPTTQPPSSVPLLDFSLAP